MSPELIPEGRQVFSEVGASVREVKVEFELHNKNVHNTLSHRPHILEKLSKLKIILSLKKFIFLPFLHSQVYPFGSSARIRLIQFASR